MQKREFPPAPPGGHRPLRRLRSVVALSIGSLLLLAAASAIAQSGASAFTTDERRQLIAGQLVRRDVTRREGNRTLFGGTSWMRVNAPIEAVWPTVVDPAMYPRLIPSLDRTRVVEQDGDSSVLFMHHSYAISETEYYMRVTVEEAEHTVRFRLDRSREHGSIREGRGFISLSSYRGGTIVSWGMLADVGAGMVMRVFGPFLNEWLLLPPRCIRDEVEPGRENVC